MTPGTFIKKTYRTARFICICAGVGAWLSLVLWLGIAVYAGATGPSRPDAQYPFDLRQHSKTVYLTAFQWDLREKAMIAASVGIALFSLSGLVTFGLGKRFDLFEKKAAS